MPLGWLLLFLAGEAQLLALVMLFMEAATGPLPLVALLPWEKLHALVLRGSTLVMLLMKEATEPLPTIVLFPWQNLYALALGVQPLVMLPPAEETRHLGVKESRRPGSVVLLLEETEPLGPAMSLPTRTSGTPALEARASVPRSPATHAHRTKMCTRRSGPLPLPRTPTTTERRLRT